MDLSEIEAKADELTRQAIETGSMSVIEMLNLQVETLKDLALIKSARDRRFEWNAQVGMRDRDNTMRERELAAMEQAAGAASQAAMTQRFVHQDAVSRVAVDQLAEDLAAPTKPAVDRLHELVSYLQDRQHGHLQAALLRSDSDAEKAQHEWASKCYDDAANKLEEILREGEL